MNSLKKQTDVALIERLERLTAREKKTTAEILEVIKEVDARKLFLKMGFTSLFAYLTEGLGYAPASAQRRIESARLLCEIPGISKDLAEGSLNLTQVSMLASGLKKRNVPVGSKKEIIERIKEKNITETQKILARDLDLPVLQFEKTRTQRDDSIRLELTFTSDQMKILKRVKDLISHSKPNPTWAELFELLGEEFLERKDPLKKRGVNARAFAPPDISSSAAEAAPDQSACVKRGSLSQALRRRVFQRDRCCQWRDPMTQKSCGSTFQLQVDHVQPVWASGSDDLLNLRLLCSVHNQLKYKIEAGIRPA